MFPVPFRKRLEFQQYIDNERLISALQEPSPVAIRINRNKWNRMPLNSEPVPWCIDGFYLESRPSFTFDPLFHAGCYYPQEASGMFLEEIFRQLKPEKENLRVLDLCGAPGGKSTHLSSLIAEGALLIANEVIRSRALVLAENLSKWGISNVIVTQNDPSSFSRLPGFFDIILADAPCSGEGMFRNLKARNEWSEENAAMCSERQKRILMDVWPALGEEGILIYSTCTFNPAENEENIKWLTERKGAESIKLDVTSFNGITEICHNGIYGYGFYPGRIKGEGFFISVIRKKEKVRENKIRISKKGKSKISAKELEIACGLMNIDHERFIRHNDKIIALPCKYDIHKTISEVLQIVKAGTNICKIPAPVGAQNFVPLQDLALSVNYKTSIYPALDLSLDQAQVYLSRGQLSPGTAQKGWNLVRYNGVNLGFINNIGTRINSYYPMEWRIRMDLRKNRNEKLIEWH